MLFLQTEMLAEIAYWVIVNFLEFLPVDVARRRRQFAAKIYYEE